MERGSLLDSLEILLSGSLNPSPTPVKGWDLVGQSLALSLNSTMSHWIVGSEIFLETPHSSCLSNGNNGSTIDMNL